MNMRLFLQTWIFLSDYKNKYDNKDSLSSMW